MPKISPFLWFDNQAEEAANFYVSVFPNSKIVSVARYGEAGPGPKGSVMTVEFELDGQEFMALNGGPQFKFSEAVSLSVDCKTQEEIDLYWEQADSGGGADRGPAAGSRTNSGCPGRSSPRSCPRCWRTPIPRRRSGSWRRC